MPPKCPPGADATVAAMARRDADRLDFWTTACRSGMRRAGKDETMCEVVAEAASQLRGLAACVEDPACIGLAREGEDE